MIPILYWSDRWESPKGLLPVVGTLIAGKCCWLYHTNVLAAVNKVASNWGCEFLFRVAREDGLTTRYVDFLEEVGEDRGARFEYRLNLGGCARTVLADEVCTALYGYGAGLAVLDEEGWTGGYHRKLTFGDVNGGVNWVGDDEAKEVWGAMEFGQERQGSHVRGGDVQ